MQQNRRTNVASYSGYIKFMGNSLSYIEALEIYKSIKDKETRNNVSVCNSILGCLIKNGKPKSSFNLFTQMKQEGLVPDVVTYTTVCSQSKLPNSLNGSGNLGWACIYFDFLNAQKLHRNVFLNNKHSR